MRNPFTMTRDEVLGTLGLQARRSAATYILPAIGMFGVGILTGAGLGLLFAPRTGREMRREIGTRMSDVTNKIKQKVRKTTNEMSQTMDEARDSLYGGNDYSSSDDYSSGLGGMDSGRRTGLTNSTT
jgi:hypothetical protein